MNTYDTKRHKHVRRVSRNVAAAIHQQQRQRTTTATYSGFAVAVVIALAGIQSAMGAPNIPSDLPPSSTFGASSFSQPMLRFEEFAVRPLPAPGAAQTAPFTPPLSCNTRADAAVVDALLDAPLWPDPTVEANDILDNPWAARIDSAGPGCLPGVMPTGGVIEGRPPGPNFSHQRYTEMPPQFYFQSAMGGARAGTGIHDLEQSHSFTVGEFGPQVAGQENQTGLYHGSGTNAGIDIQFHTSMPVQDPLNLWTFGDGTLPPKLLRTRLGVPILFRHYNALPINPAANSGFGEHTITTHEHNGHNPGEVDGFAGAYFFPGQFYDYRWPMQLAGYDSINTDASDPRAATPCSLGEVLDIPDPITGTPISKLCDPDTLTVNIAGDWHETMSTHWFHDHMIDRTSENVYKGNAAMMNYYSAIDRGKEGFKCDYDDPANVNLCFPSGTALDWGNRDYDVQLLIAAKAWDPITGQLNMAPLNEEGFLGDMMTVNWLYEPYLDVRARKYRFRILNGAVARFFKFALVREFNDATSGDFPGLAGTNTSYSRVPFHMIANDGNIMEHAIPFPNAQSNDLPIQAIAERYDIIVDFSQFPVGTTLYMVNTLEHDNGEGPKGVVPLGDILNGTYVATPKGGGCTDHCYDNDPTVRKFLKFIVQPYGGTDLSMNPADYEIGKKKMIPLVHISDAELAAAKHRTFEFGRGASPGAATDARPTPWGIKVDGGNMLNADLNTVSAAPETMGGGWEVWHIINGGGGWAHPVHIHFEEGQYLQRSDGVVAGVDTARVPPLWEQGARKDMYRVSNLGEGPTGLPDSSMQISVAIRFREFAGTFVEHCHNTTHEDKAMLLRWDNEHPGQTVRIPTPIPDWDGVSYVSVATPWQKVIDNNGNTTPVTVVEALPTFKDGNLATAAAFAAPNLLQADLNWDGIVSGADALIFRDHFGLLGLWASDVDDSGLVSGADALILRSEFGQSIGLLPSNTNPVP